jgi:hypothetical protein
LNWLWAAGTIEAGRSLSGQENTMSNPVASAVERDLSQFEPFRPEVQADLTGWFGALRR